MEAGSSVSAVRSQRVLIGEDIVPALITIKDGRIHNILPDVGATLHTAGEVLDVGNSVVMPGIVDCHVHVNEPGRTTWEGYWTATRAAAAGGVTTIVDMPLNSVPPTTSVQSFNDKLQAATGQCFVDTAFWGGVVPDGAQAHGAGRVVGFKCFLIHSGVEEFPHVVESDLHAALRELQGTGSVLLFHAEKEVQQSLAEGGDPCEYSTFLRSRPDNMEMEAVRTVTELCLQYQVRCHIVHLSSAQSLKLIRAARQAGAPLNGGDNTPLPHSVSRGHPIRGHPVQVLPPIRGIANQEQLWSALRAGDIDMVVSDHSPCTPDLKQLHTGDFTQAWGGISSLQFGLSLFWTSASKRGFLLPDVVRLLCKEPAQLCCLDNQKGRLLPGYDADLVIWDPEKEFTVKEQNIHHKNKLTPYLGLTLQGEVKATLVRGKLVYFDGSLCPRPVGQPLFINQTPVHAAL